MEKVKLTREQAEAIEENLHRGWALSDMVFRHKEGWKSGFRTCLNSLDIDEFIRALYIGYEVEPEYKEGDWVITDGYSDDYDGKALEIMRIDEEKYGTFVYFNNPKNGRDNFLITRIKRHATEEEIWWAKHGRKPWELKPNDILINEETLEYATVWSIKRQLVTTSECNEVSITTFKENSRVVCFADDRKDVQA